ncbi:MAG: glycosyl transferase [Bacteroidia bacterium]|nr:glycosyl transferase [Bacteroidia bacterium]
MKVLYAIQGTGNGHISRAREVIPYLKQYCDLDILISGTQADVQLPYDIKYKLKGVSFTFGKKGGIDMGNSIKNLHPIKFIKDIFEIPVKNYDLVINDYEPISAWACKMHEINCVAISHQAAFLSEKTPRPKNRDKFAEKVLKNYAPCTDKVAFHFAKYDSFINTPVIRSEVRQMEVTNKGHISVYLPAYADELLLQYFNKIKDVQFEVFSKHTKQAYKSKNITVKPVLNTDFINSLASSNGLITNGGFESPAEASFLGKKVMCIPMSNQYEQKCNAKAFKLLGGTRVKKIDDTFYSKVENWLDNGKAIEVNYKDETKDIIESIIGNYSK